MKLDKMLSDLKKILASDTARAQKLAAKKEQVLAALAEVNERIFRTQDAINVLEGKSSLIDALKEMQADAEKAKMPIGLRDSAGREWIAAPETEVPHASPQSGNELPPPEPGFVWQKGENGEDSLVPIALIEATKAQAAAPQTAQNFLLPEIDEDTWDNPQDMLR
jgi:hypothetical protein